MRSQRASMALVLVVSALAMLPAGASGDDCASCHTGSGANADYRYVGPGLSFMAPTFVQPNSTFDAVLTVQGPGTYELRDLKATIDLAKAPGMTLTSGEGALRSIPSMDGSSQTRTLSWRIGSGEAPRSCTFAVDVSYTVHYRHNSGGGKDNSDYTAHLSQDTEVVRTPFDISASTIQAAVGRASSVVINITAREELHNVELVPGLSLKNFTTIAPSKLGTLQKEQMRTVTINITPDRALEHGIISIIWSTDTEGSNRSSIDIGVRTFVEQVGGASDNGQMENLRWVGRVTGFIDLVLLIVLMPTGGAFKRALPSLNRAMGGAKRRVDVHCALSYLLLTVVVLHATVLMTGHYKGAASGLFLVAKGEYLSINLGTIALCLMAVISLLGMFQRPLVKAIGRRAWGWTHGIISYTALALIVVHLLWIGTTAAPLRALLS